MTTYYYTCCGDRADGYCGSGCDHRRGRIVSARRWRQLSHGAVGPWRPAWTERGTMCCSGCDCADEAEQERPAGASA